MIDFGSATVRDRELLGQSLAAEISRARAMCEAARRLVRTSPLLRVLSLRGGSDGLDPALSELHLGACGVCRQPIRGGEALLYRGPVTIHLDCARAPSEAAQLSPSPRRPR